MKTISTLDQKKSVAVLIAGTVFASIALQGSAYAQLLSYEDILSHIEGAWAIPFEEDGKEVRDCKRQKLSIWIEEEEAGLVYYSRSYSDENGAGPTIRSPLHQAIGGNGRPIPAALIKYDGEERITEEGALVEWRLYMYSRDTFTWQATHWDWSGWTPKRTRCQTTSEVS